MNAVVPNQFHSPTYQGPSPLNGFQRPAAGTAQQTSPLQLLNNPASVQNSNAGASAASSGSIFDSVLNTIQRGVEQILSRVIEQVLSKLLGNLEQSLGLPADPQQLGQPAGSSGTSVPFPLQLPLGPNGATALPAGGSIPGVPFNIPSPFNFSVNQSSNQTVAPQTATQTPQAAKPEDSILSTFSGLFSGITGLTDKLGPIWNGVKDIFSGGVGGLWSKASSLLGGVGGFIGGLF